jgi:transcription initiation factor TFIID/TFIIF subunit
MRLNAGLTRPTASSDKPSEMEGFPMREWSIRIIMLNEHGEEIPASVYSKVTYHLHESFGNRAIQSMLPWL